MTKKKVPQKPKKIPEDPMFTNAIQVHVPLDPERMELALTLAKLAMELARTVLSDSTPRVTISNCSIQHDGPGPALSVTNK